MELISITINNRSTYVRPQATVLQACEAAGVDVPRFCYHEKLSVSGNCRRCLVEIQKSPKPQVSCARPVAKGRVVFTDTPLVRKAREAVLEFLLINHPLDCPICDQGGECDLQDEALTYGSDRGRYFEFKRSVEDKECGPIVKTIRTRCIHCTRCVRFSAEVAGNEVRGAFGRGENREIGTYVPSLIRTELSGNLVDLCPVGALTSKPYAYQARSWELQRVDTVDFFDAVCSEITVHSRLNTVPRTFFPNKRSDYQPKEEIRRILPRTNGFYSENWISDRTRYAFDGLKYQRTAGIRGRVASGNPLVPLNWLEWAGHSNVAVGSKPVHVNVGSLVNLERVYSAVSFAKILGSGTFLQGESPVQLHVEAPHFYGLNRTRDSFSDGSYKSLILVGTNLRYEASLLNTRLRREQQRRANTYYTVGVFNSLRYNHTHQGNSVRTLIAYLENRLSSVQSRRQLSTATPILLGADSTRRANGATLQRLVSAIGKRRFTKTKSADRLGYVHSSVGSRSFAYLGLKSEFFDAENTSVAPVIYNVHQPSVKVRSQTGDQPAWRVSFDTHVVDNSVEQDNVLALTSLYEREGHLRNFEGRLRKHEVAVASSADTYSLEVMFNGAYWAQQDAAWYSWVSGLERFVEEVPVDTQLDVVSQNFIRNPFVFEAKNNNCFGLKLVPFFQTVRDFYLQEPIAATSPVRGECSLFLGQETNFVTEA